VKQRSNFTTISFLKTSANIYETLYLFLRNLSRRTLKFDTYLSTHIKHSRILRELQTQISFYYVVFPVYQTEKKSLKKVKSWLADIDSFRK